MVTQTAYVLFATAALLCVVSCTAVPIANHSGGGDFMERVAVRRHFSSTPPTWHASPWPDPLPLRGVDQIVARRGATSWAVEPTSVAGEGAQVWMLGCVDSVSAAPSVTAVRVSVGGGPLQLSAGSRITAQVGSTAQDDVLVCVEPGRVTWLTCPSGSGECVLKSDAEGPAYYVHDVVVDTSGALWVATARGLAWSAAVGDAPTMVDVTTDAAVAVTAARGYVAVATKDTVYWRDVGDDTPWHHLGVGGVIDPFITSLHFR
jgi:hypothetical protein